MWGQDGKNKKSTCYAGIIPTRVGTRISTIYTSFFCEDHPHACGDKNDAHMKTIGCRGSSPRVWGQDFASAEQNLQHRIIPTRVGTRFLPFGRLVIVWDHPHACGDKTNIYYIYKGTIGSSPRVWGQVQLFTIIHRLQRIIPTRVGTSQPLSR